ncbi:unnamed protein product [Arctia plantaginis]|uniref:Uncharacterized protein n=1 Tax=Arctia plantaginis TaxID=874455 RepID=A0A8S0YZ81_ARCPL|nr:unnamed protein product [Arctia plantaginis]
MLPSNIVEDSSVWWLGHCEDIAFDGGTEKQQESSTGLHVRSALSRLTEKHFLERIPPSKKKYVPECAKSVPISAKKKPAKGDVKRCLLLCRLQRAAL